MKFEQRQRALILRRDGYSLNEISKLLKVSKSSVSVWVRNVPLSLNAKKRLLTIIKNAQYVSAEKKKLATLNFNNSIIKNAGELIDSFNISKDAEKLLCAMIFWCEGNKDYQGGVAFTNSDPALVRLFIDLFVKSFNIQRERLVARLHLHEYHDPNKQINFWAKTLKLSKSQFRKTYLKPHTGLRTRENYPGCISIRYYDSILARKLMALAQAYTQKGV